jgi:hypothetical protein
MVYRTESQMGITILVKPYRKSTGMKGCGRGGSTGKKADVTKIGEEAITLYGDSFKDLCKKIRGQFKIPPHVTINSSGETYV